MVVDIEDEDGTKALDEEYFGVHVVGDDSLWGEVLDLVFESLSVDLEFYLTLCKFLALFQGVHVDGFFEGA